MDKKSILYICPTPIGNLEDITLRVLRVLKEVDFIACEDTRVTQKLLNHYEIKTKLFSYHKFSEKEKAKTLVDLMLEGKNIALVSDAGTPLISDPGSELIKMAKKENINVIPLPGACSLTTVLSATNIKDSGFTFVGFLPKNLSEKEKLWKKYSDTNLVFFESPNRLVKTLKELTDISSKREITVGRELTKIFEEIKTGNVEEIYLHYKNKPPKGEIVAVLKAEKTDIKLDAKIVEKIEQLQKEGFSTKDISKIVSIFTGISKREIYDIAMSSKNV